MDQPLTRATLMQITHCIQNGDRIQADLTQPFLDHKFPENSPFAKFMLRVAAYISLFFASVLVIFPEVGEWLITVLPAWFEMPKRIATALDYVWSLVGKPVKKTHLMYHLPNIIIYAFGVAGIRQLWRKLNKNNWKDQVTAAQEKLTKDIEIGAGRFSFPDGFSLLFVGDGDQIGKSLILDDPSLGPTFSSAHPLYTPHWTRFQASEGMEGFTRAIDQFNAQDAGEFVLFPVVDQHLFLPGAHEYDIPPHRVEISVQRIRDYERDMGWAKKRILIVGDQEQTSRFVTASCDGVIDSDQDEISLRTIAQEYERITVIDPTEVTLRRIIEVAEGRDIHFRASDDGAAKYTERFYHRLSLMDYAATQPGTLTVGYDISDLETEHQIVAKKHDSYLPVILSRDVFDLLTKRHLTEGSFIFVPRLVKEEVYHLATLDTA